MNQLLVQYSYLQVLDFMTTIAFLLNGVREGNPLVRLAVQYAPHPLGGLLAIKAAAIRSGNCALSAPILVDTRAAAWSARQASHCVNRLLDPE